MLNKLGLNPLCYGKTDSAKKRKPELQRSLSSSAVRYLLSTVRLPYSERAGFLLPASKYSWRS